LFVQKLIFTADFQLGILGTPLELPHKAIGSVHLEMVSPPLKMRQRPFITNLISGFNSKRPKPERLKVLALRIQVLAQRIDIKWTAPGLLPKDAVTSTKSQSQVCRLTCL